VSFSNGKDWVGVRLTGDSVGKGNNDGTVNGITYFPGCAPKGGIFVRESAVKLIPKANIAQNDGNNRLRQKKTRNSITPKLLSSTKNSSVTTRATTETPPSSQPSAPSPAAIEKEKSMVDNPLMGRVFLEDLNDVGVRSIHFDKTFGCYLSHELDPYPNKNEGVSWPSRVIFQEQYFNFNERKFRGTIDYECDHDFSLMSEVFELTFDTQFICVLSGTITKRYKSHNPRTGTAEEIAEIGGSTSYTKTNLDELVDMPTIIKRLEEEGATEKSLGPFRAIAHARGVYANDPFFELNIGYVKNGKEWIDMSSPRPCSYQKEARTIPLGEIFDDHKRNDKGCFSFLTEERGITIRQLEAILAMIIRLCVAEGWKNRDGKALTPETVTLYEVNTYIIGPYTKHSQMSFVERLPSTAGTQPPRWFVSHFWGEPVVDFMSCIKTHKNDFALNYSDNTDRRGGGMSNDTPVWICSYANNQNDLGASNMADPGKSSFIKAMRIANFRTLAMLDRNAEVLTRIWVIFELYTTLMGVNAATTEESDTKDFDGLWTVYTPLGDNSEAVGIVPGGATCDWGPSRILKREAKFPSNLITKATQIQVEKGVASEKSDRNTILNYIRGEKTDLDARPPDDDPKYTIVNDAVASTFSRSYATLQAACRSGIKGNWSATIQSMSKNMKTDGMEFNFEAGKGWDELSSEMANDLLINLPRNIESLRIDNSPHGSLLIDGVTEYVRTSKNLKLLQIYNTTVGDKDVGARLAKALSQVGTIEKLELYDTDLVGSRNAVEWGEALAEMKMVKALYIGGKGKSEGGPFPDAMLLDGGIQFFEGVAKSASLERLSMLYHGYGKEAIVALGNALTNNHTITEVWIGEKGSTKKDEVKAAVEKLKEDTKDRIPKVDIYYN